jgi:hypothetical protein
MVGLISQNSVEQKDMGVASSGRMFFQQIGGSLGVAALGAVFSHRLTEDLAAAAARGKSLHISASGGQLDPTVIDKLPAAAKNLVFPAIAHAIDDVFWWAVPAAAVAFVLAWFIKEVPLRGRAGAEQPAPEPELEAPIV